MVLKNLDKLANQIRQDIIQELEAAGSGHPGGSLSIVEILTALYFGGILNFDAQNTDDPERDRFILSKAHCCPALYSVFHRLGLIKETELLTLRKLGSRLQGHPDRLKLPFIETSGGSLGQGLSIACGMALSAKMDNSKYRTYVLMSDGEQEEGQTWEAVMTAAHYDLDNLTGIIDLNGLQIDGSTEHVKSLENMRSRYESFGWHVIEVDGHNIQSLINAFHEAEHVHSKPTLILARTIKGKGVSFMENVAEWHGTAPKAEEAERALEELRAKI